MNPLVLLPMVGIAAVAAVVLYVRHVAERQRTEQLHSVAPMLGFALEPGSRKVAESGLDAAMRALPLLRHGGAPRVRDVMRGRRIDGEYLVFDFRYTVSTGKSSHTIEQTVAAFRRGGAQIPAFRLHPEGLFDRIGHAFGGQDIDFESNEEFSKRYVLKGDDEDAVRGFFPRPAIVYLADQPGWHVEGAGEWLIVYRASKRVKPGDLREWLEQAGRVARAIAPH